jgi:GR25 family glycosyltransferase involved in LPS biosynthesis
MNYKQCLFTFLILIITLTAYAMTMQLKTKRNGAETYYNFENEPTLFNLAPNDFDVYLINLDRKPDRLNRFTKYYNNTDLEKVKSFTRIAAVDGKLIDVRNHVSAQGWKEIQDVEWYGYRTKHNQLTLGAVGCYLSHVNAMKALRDSNHNYAIIFEDDVRFVHNDTYKILRISMNFIPNDWDILLLGCVCHVCNRYERYQDLKHFFLMHAYVLKRSGALKILEMIENKPIRQQIDSELSTLASLDKIKVACLNRAIVVQDSSQNVTTIQTPLRVIKGINPYEIPLD